MSFRVLSLPSSDLSVMAMDVSYPCFSHERSRALDVSSQAQLFLRQFAQQNPFRCTAAFEAFEDVVISTTESLRSLNIDELAFSQVCTSLRWSLYSLLGHACILLDQVRPPFYLEDPVLVHDTREFRKLFDTSNGLSCCGFTINIEALPYAGTEITLSPVLDDDDVPLLIPSGLRGIDNTEPWHTEPCAEEASCSVCMELLSFGCFPDRNITAHCNHPPTVCLNCLALAITSQLDTKAWDRLVCPLCSTRLESGDVERFAPGETIARYSHHLTFGTP